MSRNEPTHKPCDNCSTKWMDVLYPVGELTEIKGKLYCEDCTKKFLNQTKKIKMDGKIVEITIGKDIIVPDEIYKKTIMKINRKLMKRS